MASINADLEKPCMEYKCAFENEKLQTIKLTQEFDDGTKRTRQCPIFTGYGGVECLIYIVEKFSKIARYMEWTAGRDMFNNFDLVLEDTASDHWENLTDGIADNNATRTVARFNQTISAFYLRYCNEGARDVAFDYLRSLKRPHGSSPREFAERVQTIIRRARLLDGNQTVNDEEIVKIVFRAFPEEWRKSFKRAHNVATATVQQVVQCMSNEKDYADKDKKESGSIGKRKSKSSGNDNVKRIRGGGNYQDTNWCRIHNGKHLWNECWDNPRGDNHRPNRQGQHNHSNRNDHRSRGSTQYNRNNNRNNRNNGYRNNNNYYQNNGNRNGNTNNGGNGNGNRNQTQNGNNSGSYFADEQQRHSDNGRTSHPAPTAPPTNGNAGHVPEQHHFDNIGGSGIDSTGRSNDQAIRASRNVSFAPGW